MADDARAAAVFAALTRLDGQVITKRLLDRLPGGRLEWRLAHEFGYTLLRDRRYCRGAEDGIELLLAPPSGAPVPLDVAWVRRANPRT